MAPEHQTFDSNLPCLIPVSGAFLKCLSVEVHFQFSLQMLCYSQMRCLLSLEVGRYWCVQKAESINSIQGRLRALALRLERTSACFVVPCLAVSDSGTSRTAARQAPLSLGFPRQEYWSGLLCPPPGNLPDPGIEPKSLLSLALAGGFFSTSATREAPISVWRLQQPVAVIFCILLPDFLVKPRYCFHFTQSVLSKVHITKFKARINCRCNSPNNFKPKQS